MTQRNGTGMFPREVMNRFPSLPLVEEGRLNDMPLRENFIERVLPVAKARQGLLSLGDAGTGANGSAERTTSASPRSALRLGPCPCGQGRQVPYSAQADAAGAQSSALHRDGLPRRRRGQAGLGRIDSRVWGLAHGGLEGHGQRGKHVNVLQHLMGFLKNYLSSEDNAYLR
jgi:hypothetical protein